MKTYTKKQLIWTLIMTSLLSITIAVVGMFALLRVNPFGLTLDSAQLQQAYEIISSHYYSEVDESVLQEGAVAGAVRALNDPHSSYMNAEETAAFRERLESSFEGVGAMIQQLNGKIIISDVLAGSPALAANLQPNDQLQAVDGTPVGDQTLDEVIAQVKGPAGTTVVLSIWRNGDIIEVPIVRASIAQESATAGVVADQSEGYGYIDMRQSFGSDTAKEFANALSTLGPVETLVIDLRDNPGGYLQAVNDILDTLLSKEQPYVIIEDKDGNQKPYTSKLTANAPYEYVILVNENTASAAEIMSAALQQLAEATIVGMPTYGKGTVQQQYTLLNGGVLKLTVEHWLTPDGSSINGVGVTPDIEVQSSMYYQLPAVILSETLDVNATSMKVMTVQYMLQVAGYDVSTIDGVFHENLVTILTQFQSDKGIPQTGVIDVPTANAINILLKAYLADTTHDFQLQKALELAR